MQFKFFALAAVTVGLVVAAPQIAQRAPDLATTELIERQTITANTVTASINAVTDTVEDILRIATTLNPLFLIPAIPRFFANFGRIITAVGTDVSAFLNFQQSDAPAFAINGQREIRVAFGRFVGIWIELLETILRIFGGLAGSIFLRPFTTIIEVLARGVIGFSRVIVGFVPEFETEVQQEQVQLEQSFTVVIERFN